jgi:hypothetical protein
MLKFLNLMAVGPVISLYIIGAAAAALVLVALADKLEQSTALLSSAADDVESAFGVSLLRGLASEALLVILGLLFSRIRPLGILAVLVLLIIIITIAGGAVVSSKVVGQRLIGRSSGSRGHYAAVGAGMLTISLASLMVYVGWAVAAAAILSGAGAFINRGLNSLKRPA